MALNTEEVSALANGSIYGTFIGNIEKLAQEKEKHYFIR